MKTPLMNYSIEFFVPIGENLFSKELFFKARSMKHLKKQFDNRIYAEGVSGMVIQVIIKKLKEKK